MRRLIGGLAGIGLIGGVGTVVYNHNHTGATVQIRGKNGQVQSVHLDFGKKQFSCPSGEDAKLQPLLIRQGRIKLTLNGLEKDLRQIAKEYPGKSTPPRSVAKRFVAELKHGKLLVKAYTASVDEYNATLRHDCAAG